MKESGMAMLMTEFFRKSLCESLFLGLLVGFFIRVLGERKLARVDGWLDCYNNIDGLLFGFCFFYLFFSSKSLILMVSVFGGTIFNCFCYYLAWTNELMGRILEVD